jgi:hypothetical protein
VGDSPDKLYSSALTDARYGAYFAGFVSASASLAASFGGSITGSA